MKSGLEGRNNPDLASAKEAMVRVSMKSGLEGRNNSRPTATMRPAAPSLNEVRPRRPEQSRSTFVTERVIGSCLNEVRPRRPEQFLHVLPRAKSPRIVSMKSGLEGRNNKLRDVSW